MLYTDLLNARDQMKKKREEFATALDENLSDEQRNEMLKKYDAKFQEMEQSLLHEQEAQAENLKARLAARQKRLRGAVDEVNSQTKPQQEDMKNLNAKIQEVNAQKDRLEADGIDTRKLKKERALQLAEKMQEFDEDRDRKLQQVREDYLVKIKSAGTPQEKERLLEEMGRRLKSVEEALADERRRQEANLSKMI